MTICWQFGKPISELLLQGIPLAITNQWETLNKLADEY